MPLFDAANTTKYPIKLKTQTILLSFLSSQKFLSTKQKELELFTFLNYMLTRQVRGQLLLPSFVFQFNYKPSKCLKTIMGHSKFKQILHVFVQISNFYYHA